MVNSILLFFASYKKNKSLTFIFFIIWLFNFLFVKTAYFGDVFTFINLFINLLVIIICNYSGKANKFLAPISLLIYSVIIDIYCFYFTSFPLYTSNVFYYIYNGIIFNLKYIVVPIIITIVLEIIKKKSISHNYQRQQSLVKNFSFKKSSLL